MIDNSLKLAQGSVLTIEDFPVIVNGCPIVESEIKNYMELEDD